MDVVARANARIRALARGITVSQFGEYAGILSHCFLDNLLIDLGAFNIITFTAMRQ